MKKHLKTIFCRITIGFLFVGLIWWSDLFVSDVFFSNLNFFMSEGHLNLYETKPSEKEEDSVTTEDSSKEYLKNNIMEANTDLLTRKEHVAIGCGEFYKKLEEDPEFAEKVMNSPKVQKAFADFQESVEKLIQENNKINYFWNVIVPVTIVVITLGAVIYFGRSNQEEIQKTCALWVEKFQSLTHENLLSHKIYLNKLLKVCFEEQKEFLKESLLDLEGLIADAVDKEALARLFIDVEGLERTIEKLNNAIRVIDKHIAISDERFLRILSNDKIMLYDKLDTMEDKLTSINVLVRQIETSLGSDSE